MAGHAMKESEREFYMLHAQLRAFRSVVDRSRQIIRDALQGSCRPYVSCSWGKDSTVLLHLVAEQKEDVDVIWAKIGPFDDWPGTDDIMQEFCQILPHIRVHVVTPDVDIVECCRAAGGFYVFSDTPEQRKATRLYDSAFIRAIVDKARELECDLAFIGLTEEESKRRRFLLRKRGTRFYAKTRSIMECFPLAHWTARDVWAYICSRGLPYLELYDLAPDRERARNSPMFAVDPAGKGISELYFGQIAILRQMYPEIFNRFAAEFPEVRCYV